MTFLYLLSSLTWLVPIILFFGLIVGAYFFDTLKIEYKYLLLYISVCLVIDILSRITGRMSENNLMFFLFYSLFELIFFYSFFRKFFFARNFLYYFVIPVAACYIIYEGYLLSNTQASEFQSYSKSLSSFVVLIMTIDSLFTMLKKNSLNLHLLKFYSLVFVYFSINLIFFLPINFLINAPSHIKFYFWFVHLVMTIVFYLFIVVEIWKNGVKQKPLQRGL